MPEQTVSRRGVAWFAGVEATGVVEVVDVRAQPERLAEPGWWAVVGDFEGTVRAWRFADVARRASPSPPAGGRGPSAASWTSSLDRAGYVDAVGRVRAHIQEGDVYQANLCRVLSAPLPGEPDARALGALLGAGNPAPYAGGVQVPGEVWVVTASPELFLRRRGRRRHAAARSRGRPPRRRR